MMWAWSVHIVHMCSFTHLVVLIIDVVIRPSWNLS